MHIVGRKQISKGGVTATVADAKLIFKAAIEETVPNIIVCHNHPSGNLQASEADKRLTQKLKTGSQSLDISLLDHVIIAGSSYTSFEEEGLL